MSLTTNSTVVRNEDVLSTPLDREMAILNPERNNYICLDEIGRRVWEKLAAPTGVEELCLELARDYPGEPQQITHDILIFLNELANEGLVHVAAQRSPL